MTQPIADHVLAAARELSPRALEALGAKLSSQAFLLRAAEQEFFAQLRVFDAARGWHGLGSAAEWLSWELGISLVTAREKLRVAHALAELPQLDRAWARGELTYSKLRVLTRFAQGLSEAELLELARFRSAAELQRTLRGRSGTEGISVRPALRWRRNGALIFQEARLGEAAAGTVHDALEVLIRELGMLDKPRSEARAEALEAMAQEVLASRGLQSSTAAPAEAEGEEDGGPVEGRPTRLTSRPTERVERSASGVRTAKPSERGTTSVRRSSARAVDARDPDAHESQETAGGGAVRSEALLMGGPKRGANKRRPGSVQPRTPPPGRSAGGAVHRQEQLTGASRGRRRGSSGVSPEAWGVRVALEPDPNRGGWIVSVQDLGWRRVSGAWSQAG